MNESDVDTCAWILGLIALMFGVCWIWGWPMMFVVFGAIFSSWPLVKQLKRN